MPHLCLFGSQEGQLSPSGGLYVTLFGGMDLRRPPAAMQLAAALRRDRLTGPPVFYVCLTFFGGCTLIWPTLAEEYLALHDALRAGSLTLEQWDRLVAQPGLAGPLQVHSLTLFGGFDGDELPNEERELDDLSLQRHLGHIPDDIMNVLTLGVGQRGAPRLAVVRRAAELALSIPA